MAAMADFNVGDSEIQGHNTDPKTVLVVGPPRNGPNVQTTDTAKLAWKLIEGPMYRTVVL